MILHVLKILASRGCTSCCTQVENLCIMQMSKFPDQGHIGEPRWAPQSRAVRGLLGFTSEHVLRPLGRAGCGGRTEGQSSNLELRGGGPAWLPRQICHQTSVHFPNDPDSHYNPSKEKKTPFPTNETKEGGRRGERQWTWKFKITFLSQYSLYFFFFKSPNCGVAETSQTLCTRGLVSFQQHTSSAAGFKNLSTFSQV